MRTSPLRRNLLLIATMSMALATGALAADPTFKIGVVLPKTGAFSQYGGFIEQGLRVGVRQANEKGGILGRKIELVIRDDASNPGRSLLAAKDLISTEKIDFLYPEVISGLILATLPYSTEQKLLTIANGASPQIGDVSKFPYSFQYADLATQRLPAMAAAMKHLGGQKVGILVSTNPPQVTLGDALNTQLASKFGMQVAGYKQFSSDSKDLTPLLQSLRDGGADIIAFSAAARENVRVVMQGMQTLGWKAKLVTEPAALYGDLLEQVPAPVANQFYAINYRVGVRSGPPTAAMKGFIEEMKRVGPIENLALSALARDVVLLAKWGYETAQKEKGNTSVDSVKATLETLGSRSLPPGYLLVFDNPGYSATDHSTGNATYKTFWGLVHVSPLIDGTYEGVALQLLP